LFPLNLPNALTLIRILLVPVLVVALTVETPGGDTIAAIVFAVAALTDGLDGYIARSRQSVTTFGKVMDPVADKLMVAAALIVLTEFGRIYALVALIIIGREITISALREWMASIGRSKSVAVNMAGKVKTVAQLVAIPFLLFDDVLFELFHTRPVGHVLIWVAAGITLWSMVVYLKAAWRSGALHEK